MLSRGGGGGRPGRRRAGAEPPAGHIRAGPEGQPGNDPDGLPGPALAPGGGYYYGRRGVIQAE